MKPTFTTSFYLEQVDFESSPIFPTIKEASSIYQ